MSNPSDIEIEIDDEGDCRIRLRLFWATMLRLENRRPAVFPQWLSMAILFKKDRVCSKRK